MAALISAAVTKSAALPLTARAAGRERVLVAGRPEGGALGSRVIRKRRAGSLLCRVAETEAVGTALYGDAADAAEVTLDGAVDGVFSVTGVLRSDAPAALVYGILTDYDATARVFENILSSTAEEGEDGRPRLVQDCRWSFLLLQGSFRATLAVTADPESGTVEFDLVESGFMKHFHGRWAVEPAAGGGCQITHNLEVEPTLAPPPPLGFYTKRIFAKQVGEIMMDLENEIVRREQ